MKPADHRAGARAAAVRFARWDVPRHLARLLLVACTVLGVAALHSIGHATADRPLARPPVTAVPPVLAVVAAGVFAPGDTSDDGCGGDGCNHRIAQPDRDRYSTAWWEACLAVFGALIVAVSLFARAARRHPAATTAGERRPPPDELATPPAGLLLARTAVLRT